MNMREDPIFISGCPKSGTTLAARLLSNSPDIQLDYDLSVAWEFLRDQQRITTSPMVQGESKDPLNGHARWLIESGKYDRISKDFFAQLHSGVRDHLRWGNSAKPCLFFHHRLIEWFPEAQFILMLRNPLDVWASLKHAQWDGQIWSKNITGFADTYKKFFSYTKHPGIITIKYEDLIIDPTLIHTRLGLPIPGNLLDGTGDVFAGRTLPIDPTTSHEDGIRNRVGRWEKELFTLEMREILDRCAVAFEEYYS